MAAFMQSRWLLCGEQICSCFIFPLYIIIYILKICYIFVNYYGISV